MTVLLAGLGWAGGVPWQLLAVATTASMWPFPSAAAMLGLLAFQIRSQRDGVAVSPEARWLLGVASDLRAGQSLRMALHAACSSRPGEGMAETMRLIEAGRPTPVLADELGRALGPVGPMVAAAVRLSAVTGGAAAALFEELATQVMQAEDLRRELRAAVAPVLAQGVIVGGVPLTVVAWMAASGRLLSLLSAGPVEAAVVVTGLALVLSGVGAVASLMWRSRV